MYKKLFEYLTEKPKCQKCGEKMLDYTIWFTR